MAHFKNIELEQTILVPVDLPAQLQRGTFERTLNEIVDRLDLSGFAARFRNDECGAPAYPPGILLKVLLYAYSRGVFSSRRIAEACRTNTVFMALSGNQQPDFTTLADFVSGNAQAVEQIFSEILRLCARRALIGFEMFAVDGCKLSSNAGKEWSGNFADLANKRRKLEGRAWELMRKHRRTDDAERRRTLRRA